MDFDERAARWDDVPQRRERAEAAAAAIASSLGDAGKGRGFEFGCGTGLLSFCLRDRFDEIVLLDTSRGMIDELDAKIEAFGIKNMRSICGSLEESAAEIGKVDAVYSLMALHHVVELDPTLARFFSILKPGGRLFIADLDKEDGSFHKYETDFRGHNGFDRAELAESLRRIGFQGPESELFYENQREVDGVLRSYPLFLLSATKSN